MSELPKVNDAEPKNLANYTPHCISAPRALIRYVGEKESPMKKRNSDKSGIVLKSWCSRMGRFGKSMVLQNWILHVCLVFGLFSNLYLLLNLKQLNNNENDPPVSCDIDTENLLNLLQSRKVQDHQVEIQELTARPNFEKTIQTSLFAVGGGGGLGNLLFELISLRGIADTLQRTPIINVIKTDLVDVLFKKIQPAFPNLVAQFELRIVDPNLITRQQCNFGACCRFDDPFKFVNNSAEHLLLDGHYFQSFKYFLHIRSSVRQWLAPTNLAALRAEILIPVAHRQDFIICTHVRRGDFQYDGVHQPSDATFSRLATDFLVRQYQKTHRNVTVVVLGNDIKFAHTVFQDRAENFSSLPMANRSAYDYVVPENSPKYTALLTPTLSPEVDLAFSRIYCDVTLITAPSSTFGWWISYLAKNEAVTYYRDILESKDGVAREMRQVDFYPPEWIKLKTDRNGKIQKSMA